MEQIIDDKRIKFRDPRLNRSREIPPEVVIFGRFSNNDNFRLEVAIDVISGAVVDPSGKKVRVKFGDSRLNYSRDI